MGNRRFPRWLLDVGVIGLMCVLLYVGASWQIFGKHTDAAKYQCYALAFWQGLPAASTLLDAQCSFIQYPSTAALERSLNQFGVPGPLRTFMLSQSPAQPLHALPFEYPLLTLVPFSLGLVAPPDWYQVAFACWMAAFAALTARVLLRWRSRQAAWSFALCLVAGGWATVAGRFDIVPALLTLIALLCAERQYWNRAFILLALATMLKFYPLIFVVPFWLALQLEQRGPWYARGRWIAPVLYVLVCAGLVLLSFALSVVGTIGPFSYFSFRPIQAESLLASFQWLLALVTQTGLHYDLSYGSLNASGLYTAVVSLAGTLLLLSGFVVCCWLQWRRKIDLALASLLFLLVLVVTNKVFSPQYLIWVLPFVAYVGMGKVRWTLVWTPIGLLTTWVYPYIYGLRPRIQVPLIPLFYPVVTIRNFLLCGFVLVLLINCLRRPSAQLHHPLIHDEDQAQDGEQRREDAQQRLV